MIRNKYSLIIFIIFLIYLVFTFPFWTGELFRNVGDFANRQVNIPQEYYQLSNSLNENKLDSVVFPVPINKIGMGSFWWNDGKDGYASIYPSIYMLSSKRTFYIDYDSVNDYNLSKLVTDKKYLKFLGFQNISTIIFHNDINWGTVTDSPYWYPDDRDTFNHLQEKIKSVFPDNVTTIGQLTSINIVNSKSNIFLPHVFTTNKILFSEGEIKDLPDIVSRDDFDIRTAVLFKNKDSFIKDFISGNSTQDNNRVTEFKNINPTKYRLVIHQTSKPFILIFNEQYHPDWRLYLTPQHSSNGIKSLTGRYPLKENLEQATSDELTLYLSRNWLDSVGAGYISKNFQGTIQNDNLSSGNLLETLLHGTVVTSAKHLQVNGNANGWTIDPSEICQKNKSTDCVKNPNGTYDISLIIEFWPQHLFNLGSAISLITLLICLTYILKPYRLIKIIHKKR